MPAGPRSPRSTEHKLPHPKRRINPFRDPFVGNRSVNDNLREMVEIALWKALGDKAHALSVVISDFAAELTGTLDSAKDRKAALEAAKSTDGVASVIDRIEIRGRASIEPPSVEAEPTQMIVLRRFCALDEPSTSAAIRQAVARLDALFADAGKLPERLVILYSNLLPQTVTLDIGMPAVSLPQLPPDSEFHVAPVPVVADVEVRAGAGFDGLIAAWAELLQKAGGAEHHAHKSFWQSFSAQEFRPWAGHPEATIHLVP